MAIRKSKHWAEKSVGKAKVVVGRAVGSRRLAAKGRAQQAKADLKQAGDRVRHSVNDAIDALNDWSRRAIKTVRARRTVSRGRRHVLWSGGSS